LRRDPARDTVTDVERGTAEELAEFAALSAKVSDKHATEAERARWRELREKLAGPKPPPRPRPGAAPPPPRKHARAIKKLRLSFAHVKEMTRAFSEEVGAGGLRLVMSQHVEIGTKLVVRLELKGAGDPDPLIVAAKVVWTNREGNHYQVGLEFEGLRTDERERIEAYAHSTRDVVAPAPAAVPVAEPAPAPAAAPVVAAAPVAEPAPAPPAEKVAEKPRVKLPPMPPLPKKK
jgi:hypothetical protein